MPVLPITSHGPTELSHVQDSRRACFLTLRIRQLRTAPKEGSMHSIQSLEELRHYVQETLCERHALDPQQFPLVESLLTRAGRPCGLYFCQHGPRLMKAHAVWDGEHAV